MTKHPTLHTKYHIPNTILTLIGALVVVLVIIGVWSYLHPNSVSAWWDETWGYRQKVEITNSGSAQTDFQTMITLDTQTLEDAGKIQADCDDLRITDNLGNLLNFWIEPTTCSTSATKIWVKVPSVPASGATVYLYYGNPSASSGQATTSNVFIREISNVQGAWTMDEASWTNDCSTLSILDSSGNSLNGASCPNSTGATGGATGKFNNGGSFTSASSQYFSIADNNSLDFTTAMTISYWYKRSASGVQTFVGRWTDNQQSYGLQVSTDNRIYLDISGTGSNLIYFQSNSATYSDTNWNHLVGVYDGSTLTVYLNGSTVAGTITGTVPASLFNSTTPLENRYSGGNYYSGSVDDLRVYNRALTSSEISDLYGTGGDRQGYTTANYANKELVRKYSASVTVGSPSNEEKSQAPVAYWKFDEGFGQTTQDSTSNNNDGTLGANSGSSTDDPTWTIEDQCISGKCLKFDGTSDFVDLGNPSWSNTTGSIEAWIKLTFTDAAQIVSISKGAATDNYLQFYTYNNSLYLLLNNGATVINFNNTLTVDNKWHHVAVTQDGSTSKMYIDGKLQPNTDSGEWLGNLSGLTHYRIGNTRYNNTDTNYFKGFIDEPKIYNYARTAAQIKADYASRGGSKGSAAVMGQATQDFMSNGLVGYWKMDESSWSGAAGEVLDASGNGNNGVRAGSATTGSGKFGNGGVFNGTTDYASIGNSITGINGSAVTVAAWVKTNSIGADQFILDGSTGASYGDGLSIRIRTTGDVRFWNYNAQYNVTSSTTLSASTWYHLVGTWDGTTSKLYINGAINVTNTGDSNNLGNTYQIGHSNVLGGYFNGFLDDVRIYNRAISAAEVQKLYEFAPGPVLHLKMDENVSGDAQTLNDSSGYGNNGTTVDGANNTGMSCNKPGKYGASCQFDGTDDYMNIDNVVNTVSSNALGTVEAWVNIDSSVSAANPMILSLGDTNASTAFLFNIGKVVSPSKELRAGLYRNGSYDWDLQTDSSLSTGSWHHVAIVQNGTIPVLYVDGVQVAQTFRVSTDKTKWLSATSGIDNGRIGANNLADTGNNLFFKGSIDDVKVYNYARSAGQILADYGTGLSQKQPVAHYRFDEGNGQTANNSGNGGSSLNGTLGANTGSSTDDPTWTNSGKFGKALDFEADSDQYITVTSGSTSPLNFAGSMTVSTWIKAESLASSGYARRVLSTFDGSSDGIDSGSFGLDLSNISGFPRFFFYNNSDTAQIALSSTSLSTGTWYHLLSVYDESSATVKIYINGRLDTTQAISGTRPAITSNLGLGWDLGYQNPGFEFDGLIDEVKIYSYALTANEVKTEYNHGQSLQLGSSGSNTSYAQGAANQEYCIPGDSTSCAAPVAEWRFDENSGTSAYDKLGNNNTGTWYGTGPHWAPGKISGGGKFNGSDDYVDMGDPASGNLDFGTGDFTVEGWFKLNAIPGTTTNEFIASKELTGSPYTGWDLAVSRLAGNPFPRFQLYPSGTQANGTTNIAANTWYHMAGVKNGNNLYVYLNGVREGSNTGVSGDNVSNAINLFVGKRGDGGNVNGIIDNVRIYNYARSAVQVAWDYNRGAPVGHWKFNECQGNQTKDASGNGNTGTITIGATGTQTTGGTCTAPTDGTGAWHNGSSGKYNSSLKFDGTDDYVDMGDPASGLFDFGTSAFSAGLWLKRSSVSSGYRTFISKDDGNPGWYVQFISQDEAGKANKIRFGTRAGSFDYLDSDQTITDTTTWHHIVVTRDSSGNKTIYIDGVADNTSNDSSINVNATNGLRVGQIANLQYFDGQIDDVRIYNYALTGTQVKNLYNQNSAIRFGP